MRIVITCAALLLAASITLLAEEAVETAKATPHPLETCLVSGEAFDPEEEPQVFTHSQQEIKVCCKHCKGTFLKDPETYLKKLTPAKDAHAGHTHD